MSKVEETCKKNHQKWVELSRSVAISEMGYVCFAAVALVDSSISQSRHGGASFHVQLPHYLVSRTFQAVRSLLFHHGTAWFHAPDLSLTSNGADTREDGCEVSDWDLKNTTCFAGRGEESDSRQQNMQPALAQAL